MALIFFFFFLSNLFFSGVMSRSFTIANKCEYTVWPGILSNAGVPPLPTTGFVLQRGETLTIDAPSSWGGRFWGRTLCSTDSEGKFSCATGDCGSGKLECSGTGAAPPTTLAEFTLDGSGGLDFYDVSLVDGYNVQMLVVPQGGSGQNCSSTGCVVDLNGSCPMELRVNSVDGDGRGRWRWGVKARAKRFGSRSIAAAARLDCLTRVSLLRTRGSSRARAPARIATRMTISLVLSRALNLLTTSSHSVHLPTPA